MGNVGIIGRARVGKDTVGAWFTASRGYKRVSFADPLRDCALKLDPVVGTDEDDWATEGERLSDVVKFWGWETAKERVPEVRRVLQGIGQGVRDIDPDFWLRTALAKATAANEAGQPVVVTDVRYPNEATSLRRAGFHLVYIHRPDVPQLVHDSEGALTAADADHVLVNDSSLSTLMHRVEVIAERIYEAESRKHYGRSL